NFEPFPPSTPVPEKNQQEGPFGQKRQETKTMAPFSRGAGAASRKFVPVERFFWIQRGVTHPDTSPFRQVHQFSPSSLYRKGTFILLSDASLTRSQRRRRGRPPSPLAPG